MSAKIKHLCAVRKTDTGDLQPMKTGDALTLTIGLRHGEYAVGRQPASQLKRGGRWTRSVRGPELPILTGGDEGLAELSSPLVHATIARCRPSIFRHALITEFPMPDTEAGSVLTIDIDRIGSETTVHCHGRLVAGVDGALYSKVSQLIPGSKRIVMDLSDLKHMDSMGLGALVRLYVSTKSAGCELVLINLGQQIRHLLGLTNLFSVFTVIGENGIRLM